MVERRRLEAERENIETAMRRQALRLEEQDDLRHPVVRLAKERIEELGSEAESVDHALTNLESGQRDEIEAILSSIPDLRDQLERAEGKELIELLDVFDVMISYDKLGQTLTTSVLLNADFPNRPDASAIGDQSQGSGIAGGRIRTDMCDPVPLLGAARCRPSDPILRPVGDDVMIVEGRTDAQGQPKRGAKARPE